MTAFNKEVAVEHFGTLTFCFIPTQTPGGKTYYVTVEERSGNTYTFTMKPKGDDWTIINAPKVPDWILAIEQKLAGIIKNQSNPDVAE